MIDKVKKTIARYNLLNRGDKVIVALSGGPDSVALLGVLAEIAPQMDLHLMVAHFNHGLRGAESEEDEKYCRRLSRNYGLAFVAETMDENKREKGVSPEDHYRRQRYAFLNKTAKNQQAQKIALGHNLHDQAQTVLLRLLRGSSPEGLKGILPMRENKFIRPLIEISRKEIMDFLNEAGIAYRQDSSNKSRKYLRNKIREDLIPQLKKEFNPRIEENLAQTAQILRQEDEFINSFVTQAGESSYITKGENRVCLNVDYLQKLHPAIRLRLFKTLLDGLNSSNQRFSFIHLNFMEKMTQEKESGRRISLPGKIIVRREYDQLVLERRAVGQEKIKYEYPITIPGSLYVKEKNVTVGLQNVTRDYIDYKSDHKYYMDLDTLRPPLILRNRRDGDWFEPMGMSGRKKIKDFFIDRKVPRLEREKTMLIADAVSVVWIEKMRLSERVKITTETRNVLEVKIIEQQKSQIKQGSFPGNNI